MKIIKETNDVHRKFVLEGDEVNPNNEPDEKGRRKKRLDYNSRT